MIHIEESGLYLGDYDESCFFHIEKSRLYTDLGQGIRTVEFILRRNGDSVCYVEAKSSAPNPRNNEDFQKFIIEVSEKIIHSNDLFFSLITKRKTDVYNEFPSSFSAIDYSGAIVTAVLIINNFELEWLSPIKEALEQSLKRQIKTWRLDVVVLNQELAAQKRLAKKRLGAARTL